MSKNTGQSRFRKVDVDQFDEDKFQDENVEEDGEAGPNEGEINTLLSQNRQAEALKHVLNHAPLLSKNTTIKDRAAQLALRVLTSFKSSDIEPAVKSLDEKQTDMLMKYIYRGFEVPSEGSSAVLLTWHEKTYRIGGLGSIVRVLADRKRV
ncbi:actin-related protein 2/3 complex subunit 5-like [Liolophura sinensis]|uniref:actin-related protein 2/3 complex subunit 5-like n=1 Tax=Liolophura sinensis TaxID=3198878 RepID=UPI0031590F71